MINTIDINSEILTENNISQYQPVLKVELFNYISKPLTVEETASCEELVNLFKQNPESECVVLIDNFKRPLALFMRNALFMKFSRRYSSDLFYDKSVMVLFEEAPLVVDLSISLEAIIQSALNRPLKTKYDCVVLVKNQILQGILTLSNILELSSELQRYAKYEQSMLIEKATGYVHHIADQMKAVESEIVKQQEQFSNMIDFTLQGKNLLQSMLNSYEQIDQNINLQNMKILDMKKDSTQLKKMAHDVVELAEQTNILALNATIEAAKAKEHGLAFTVVANEVKSLSTRTKRSVSNIQQVVQLMLNIIAENEGTSQASILLTSNSRDTVSKTEEVFKLIFETLAIHQKEMIQLSKQAQYVTGLTLKTNEELKNLNDYMN